MPLILHPSSVIGCITNSSAEVFFVPSTYTLENLKTVIDELWTIWKRDKTDAEICDMYFSLGPDDGVIPEQITPHLKFEVLTDETAPQRAKHWHDCAVFSMQRLLAWAAHPEAEKDERGPKTAYQQLLDTYAEKPHLNDTEFNRQFKARVKELIGAVERFQQLPAGNTPEFYEAVEGIDFSDELMDDAWLLRDIDEFRSPKFHVQQIRRDLQWARACVPGAIVVDSPYNSAPEEFCEAVISFLDFVGGQIG